MSSRRSASGGRCTRHDVEPVIEILAETAGGDLVRRDGAPVAGDDAHIHLHDALPADAGEALVRQHPQDLALGGERHVGDLVEEERAAMGLLQQAGRAHAGRILGAEQLLLDALRRHRARPRRRRRARWRAGSNCGGGARPPPCRRRPGREISTRLPVGATRVSVARTALMAADWPVSSSSWPTWALRLCILAPQPLRLRGAGDEVEKAFGLERLLDEVGRTATDGGHRRVEIAVPGDHQHRQRRIAPLDLVQQVEAIQP